MFPQTRKEKHCNDNLYNASYQLATGTSHHGQFCPFEDTCELLRKIMNLYTNPTATACKKIAGPLSLESLYFKSVRSTSRMAEALAWLRRRAETSEFPPVDIRFESLEGFFP